MAKAARPKLFQESSVLKKTLKWSAGQLRMKSLTQPLAASGFFIGSCFTEVMPFGWLTNKSLIMSRCARCGEVSWKRKGRQIDIFEELRRDRERSHAGQFLGLQVVLLVTFLMEKT